ncbi:helix-turn-helix domain-containing protein [Morganella morganii]|uniref:helix-turn-helix domain-containing protein n=1 Tax=Morganella morganii TaxID=582 RepID=UPI0021D2D743|nr:helix-turn-helix domain-containing protein [Morganella morganii]MCU6273320.1 helix-turn-helix domain-containing protein [Morganella morganii]
MSMILTARALQIKTGNALRKLVLVKLADNANDQGESWPSVPYIAEQCEMSERSVQNHINALVEMGLVRIESRKSANGLNQSNIYHLRLNAAVVSGESAAPYGANPAGVSGANGYGTGAADSPGGATGSDSGAGAAPRISHDPIIDPDNKNIISCDEKTNVKTAMPESFEPGRDHAAKAEASGLDVQEEFQKFSDYHASKGTKYTDWHRAFSYWLGQAANFKRRTTGNNTNSVERDEAFTRLIGSRSKPRNRTEEIALVMAGKTGIRTQTEFMGRKTWIDIWKQATEQAIKEREAA